MFYTVKATNFIDHRLLLVHYFGSCSFWRNNWTY